MSVRLIIGSNSELNAERSGAAVQKRLHPALLQVVIPSGKASGITECKPRKNEQTFLLTQVFQGSSDVAPENEFLGQIRCEVKPDGKARRQMHEISMTLNTNGGLE